MPSIQLPRKIKGKELTDIIRKVGEEQGFKYYYFPESGISVSRQFPEHVPEQLRNHFDVTPSLGLRFGEIDPEAEYSEIQINPVVGTMHVSPADFESGDIRYAEHYNQFIESLQKG